jgi:oxalate decarboxylase/phosphoglucose isomerase-like protein (cupin superfamily)
VLIGEDNMLRHGDIKTPVNMESCHIPKGWGEEIIIENNEMYCGKILVFKAGCKFSMHYHMNKDETWWVEEGEFNYTFIDTETALPTTLKLSPGLVEYLKYLHTMKIQILIEYYQEIVKNENISCR